jgi:acetyl-CoA carboxylase carboxyl transferase subunit beta
VPIDPLKFKDEKRYADRLREARAKTGQQDALQAARGNVGGVRTTVAVQSFDFMGGSLGMAVGEGLVASMRAAVDHRTPYVLFTASGGARMQEGILSLMQMPRVTIAIQMLREAGLPYVVVHTDPTTGGVTASYAMLGDVHVSEPGALIGFAGPRVIENTIREKLPEGFQRAEYLLDHGMVDMVVHRHKMRENLGRLLKLLTRKTTRASRTGYEPGPYAVPLLQAAQPTPFERPSQPSI